MRWIQRLGVAVFSLVVFAAFTARAEQAKPAAGDVSVTVKYAGKGMVDANHKIWVWLFTSPDIGPGSIPIAEDATATNGGTVTFSNITSTVYLAVAYDEKGGFVGQSPPPPGSPIGIYGAKGPEDKPLPITPGAKGAVKIAFTDAQRMQ